MSGGFLGLLAAWWITSTLGAVDMPIIRGRVFRYDATPDLQVFSYAVAATAVATRPTSDPPPWVTSRRMFHGATARRAE